MNILKKIFINLMLIFILIFPLASCGLLGDSNAGLMISKIEASNLSNGDTELTIFFTDDDYEPITFLIPKGESGDKGETGERGIGIKSIVPTTSSDPNYTNILITYTDESIPPTILEVKNGVSVKDIKSSINLENNTTDIEFILSDNTAKSISIPNGRNGVGIKDVNTTQNENGDYVITISYTDNRTPSIIKLPYKNGVDGNDGADGRGIKNILGTTIDNDYMIEITYDDDTKDEMYIPLPKTTKWFQGNDKPGSLYEEIANEGDFYFDINNAVIYNFSMGSFNKIIDLKESHMPNKTYEVTFDSNGGAFVGSLPNKLTVIAGMPIQMNRIPICQKEGMKFIGYYTTIEGKENPLSGKLTDLTPIFSDITFYAQYE